MSIFKIIEFNLIDLLVQLEDSFDSISEFDKFVLSEKDILIDQIIDFNGVLQSIRNSTEENDIISLDSYTILISEINSIQSFIESFQKRLDIDPKNISNAILILKDLLSSLENIQSKVSDIFNTSFSPPLLDQINTFRETMNAIDINDINSVETLGNDLKSFLQSIRGNISSLTEDEQQKMNPIIGQLDHAIDSLFLSIKILSNADKDILNPSLQNIISEIIDLKPEMDSDSTIIRFNLNLLERAINRLIDDMKLESDQSKEEILAVIDIDAFSNFSEELNQIIINTGLIIDSATQAKINTLLDQIDNKIIEDLQISSQTTINNMNQIQFAVINLRNILLLPSIHIPFDLEELYRNVKDFISKLSILSSTTGQILNISQLQSASEKFLSGIENIKGDFDNLQDGALTDDFRNNASDILNEYLKTIDLIQNNISKISNENDSAFLDSFYKNILDLLLNLLFQLSSKPNLLFSELNALCESFDRIKILILSFPKEKQALFQDTIEQIDVICDNIQKIREEIVNANFITDEQNNSITSILEDVDTVITDIQNDTNLSDQDKTKLDAIIDDIITNENAIKDEQKQDKDQNADIVPPDISDNMDNIKDDVDKKKENPIVKFVEIPSKYINNISKYINLVDKTASQFDSYLSKQEKRFDKYIDKSKGIMQKYIDLVFEKVQIPNMDLSIKGMDISLKTLGIVFSQDAMVLMLGKGVGSSGIVDTMKKGFNSKEFKDALQQALHDHGDGFKVSNLIIHTANITFVDIFNNVLVPATVQQDATERLWVIDTTIFGKTIQREVFPRTNAQARALEISAGSFKDIRNVAFKSSTGIIKSYPELYNGKNQPKPKEEVRNFFVEILKQDKASLFMVVIWPDIEKETGQILRKLGISTKL